MPNRLSTLAAAALAALTACSSAQESTPCQDAAQCPAQARCIQATCVANTPPSAAIAPVAGTVAAFEIAQLNGGGSSDLDAGDEIASYAWTVSSIDAPCLPPAVASTSSVVSVRFACAGRYLASLVVTDALAATSAPATREVSVGPGTSAIVAGLDVSVAHACAGDPLVCSTSPVLLTASQSGTSFPDLTWSWRAIAPLDRPLEAGRRATIDADGPSAVVQIETDALAISGDWLFEVTASDAAGAVGVATQRLSVLNRPPEIVADPPATFEHAFDRLASIFTAGGSFAVAVTDPDGDPITREFTSNHTGDDGAAFAAAYEADAISFSVIVPYGDPAGATKLIGPGVSRSATLAIGDVNGASVTRTFDLVVGNRAPRSQGVPASVSVNHGFDAAASRYFATAAVGTWLDDDGDPLFQAGPTGSTACATLSFGSSVEVECRQDYQGVPNVSAFATVHNLVVEVRDPWTAAPSRTVDVAVLNRAPTLSLAPSLPSTRVCTEGTSCCVAVDPKFCDVPATNYSGGVVTAEDRHADPDGDPLDVTLGGTRIVCLSGACSVVATVGSANNVCDEAKILLTANDGLASTSGQASVACGSGAPQP